MSDAKFTPYERKLIDELTAAKAENEALRGRAEQAEARVAAQSVLLFCLAAKIKREEYLDKATHDAICAAVDGNSEAWLLRKQAEAVSDFGQPFDRMHRMVDSRAVHEDAEDYAQRLRQQADELEQ